MRSLATANHRFHAAARHQLRHRAVVRGDRGCVWMRTELIVRFDY
jgi:hypothetical protein